LATYDLAHINGYLRIRNDWNYRDSKRQTDQSTSHRGRP
jgi:hypothetical protein